MTILKILKVTLPTLLLIFLFRNFTFAQSYSEAVDISLRLSLCGDGIVEGEEDCEVGINVGKSCLDFGYQDGTLTCDYSCSFDFSSCKYVPKEKSEINEIENDNPNLNVESQEQNNPLKINYLPFFLRLFDFNRDGNLDFVELSNLLIDWVANWKIFRQVQEKEEQEVLGACDINNDQACNVIDFSIILYYVDND